MYKDFILELRFILHPVGEGLKRGAILLRRTQVLLDVHVKIVLNKECLELRVQALNVGAHRHKSYVLFNTGGGSRHTSVGVRRLV